MSVSLRSVNHGYGRWLSIQKAAAALAAAAFFGAVIAAPLSLSLSSAQALDHESSGFQRVSNQQFAAPTGAEPSIDLTYAAATEVTTTDGTPTAAQYSLSDFLFSGVINWGGHKFTFYSQQVLPGGGLAIPGRHVNAAGYISDSDGYIVLAGSAPKGTVFDTPFGYKGKIYDRGTVGNHLDVYIR